MTEYTEIVSGRVSKRAKTLMQEYGFSVRDAVEWFILAKCNPKKNLEYRKTIVQEEILQLKIDLICKESELDEIKRLEGEGWQKSNDA